MARDGIAAALWAGFALLVVAGGWLFLRACGLDALGLDYCPAPADHAALARERAAGEELAGQVHTAQMAVAEKPVCAPPAAPPPATPVPPPKRAEVEAIDRKVVERGGQNGKLQFTLQWNTLDDLDLDVVCPGGTIDSRPGRSGPGICGDGRKDIDANGNLARNVSSTPIENVVWQGDPPPGRYVVEIVEFRATTRAGNAVPFTLRIRWNDQERVCRDVVTTMPEASTATDADGVIGGVAKLLAWTLGDPLPDCDFVPQNTHNGAAPK